MCEYVLRICAKQIPRHRFQNMIQHENVFACTNSFEDIDQSTSNIHSMLTVRILASLVPIHTREALQDLFDCTQRVSVRCGTNLDPRVKALRPCIQESSMNICTGSKSYPRVSEHAAPFVGSCLFCVNAPERDVSHVGTHEWHRHYLHRYTHLLT